MINCIVSNPRILDRFLAKFRPLFTKPSFASFSAYTGGIFLELKRASIKAIVDHSLTFKYQNAQYFISEAQWNPEALNDQRVSLIERDRLLQSKNYGVAVIDDTSCKKWGYKTEGAQVQYYATEKQTARCNVVVFSAYSDQVKQFPITIKPYIPKDDPFFLAHPESSFKDKISLAHELIDDLIARSISFADIVFDSWYFAKSIVEYIHSLQLTYITEADANRLISFRGKWSRADELPKLISAERLKPLTVTRSSGDPSTFYVHSFVTKVRNVSHRVLVTVCVGSWSTDDLKGVHVFVSNHLSYSPEQIIKKYLLRWGIECIFRSLKEHVYFDHYQTRSLKAITRHWHIAALAYTFLLWCKLHRYLARYIADAEPSPSLAQQLLYLRKLHSRNTAIWISHHPNQYFAFLSLSPNHAIAA
jgi:SRSO17 transposase